MNKFIEIRKKIYEYDNPYIFPLSFLEEYIKTSKTISLEEGKIIKKIQRVKDISFKDSPSEKEFYEILSFLGEEEHLNTYIVDLALKKNDENEKDSLEKAIKSIMDTGKDKPFKLYHLIDISIECLIKVIDEEETYLLIEKYKSNFDIVSILLDYLYSFRMKAFKENIYDLLAYNYPLSIKLQIIGLLVDFYGREVLDEPIVKNALTSKANKNLYDDYSKFLFESFQEKDKGLVILQSMFYGDFENSGKGNNGGLAVLLKSLGNEISRNEKTSRIFTITVEEKCDKAFLNYYSDKHIFIRFPIFIDRNDKEPFIKRELFVKRYIYRYLKRANISPDIFHVRYLDNASKAVAKVSKEINKKLIFTLTPDPHRTMFDNEGNLREYSFVEFIEKLNKIIIGDELVYKSHGIIGIGNKNVKKELDRYFPQLLEKEIAKKLIMIGEGIQADIKNGKQEFEDILDDACILGEIKEEFFDKPIILNVGRLDNIKGQIELLKAWGDSKLCQTHNLLIIGGDLINPNKEEERIISFFKDYIRKNPHLEESFYHIGAIENQNIRLLEKYIMKKDLDYPHIYLCSSIKEEFGLAILEAQSQGFLIIGPKKGGVKAYIRNRENGFLIDTSNSEMIAKETIDILYNLNIGNKEFEKIQKAGKKTVNDYFSIEKISQRFLSFYLYIKGEENNEI